MLRGFYQKYGMHFYFCLASASGLTHNLTNMEVILVVIDNENAATTFWYRIFFVSES